MQHNIQKARGKIFSKLQDFFFSSRVILVKGNGLIFIHLDAQHALVFNLIPQSKPTFHQPHLQNHPHSSVQCQSYPSSFQLSLQPSLPPPL
jgi:hypothetical protein